MANEPRNFGEQNIGATDFSADYHEDVVQADPLFKQAFSFLLGWIPQKERWKQLIIDIDGRLLVSSSPTKSNTGIQSIPTPTTSSASMLSENVDRKQMIIQNTGSVDVFLSFTGEDATLSDFKLVVDAVLIEDVYYGQVKGITESATGELRILELT